MFRNLLGAALGVGALTLALASGARAQTVATPYSYNTVLSAASPTFNRPLTGTPPTSLSAVGTSASYGTLTFTPNVTGTFTLETTAASLSPGTADDTFLVLYLGSFNPASPLTNVLQADDDAGVGALSLMSRTLNSGQNYVLVTTTFGNAAFGSITTRIAGPANSTITLGGAAAAPEPASLALAGFAAIGLLAVRRRRAAR